MNLKIPCIVLGLSFALADCSVAEQQNGASFIDWQTKAIASAADLDRVMAQLQAPATRFDAFQALLNSQAGQKETLPAMT
jgi:Tfp pilus assembly protein PilN